MEKSDCPLCGGQRLHLPIPLVGRSVASDGRVLEVSLEKASCLSCGLVSHVNPLCGDTIQNVYREDYALTSTSPSSDRHRAQNYADVLTELLAPAKTVLEIGCGSGALLRELETRWPEASLFGMDPALPDGRVQNGRTRFERDSFEAYAAAELMDLIFSVNVIEHVSSPKTFFTRVVGLLSSGGQLAIICPAANPPNLELVIHDHLHTFTSHALAIAARSTGCTVTTQIDRVERLGDFQFILFRRSDVNTIEEFPRSRKEAVSLAASRTAYLGAWCNLEETLLARTAFASRTVLFGAGQMAALLRAYAPRIWDQVDLLVVDNVSDAWRLDKPVSRYSDTKRCLGDAVVLVATAPSIQAQLANRLVSDGLRAVRFDDIIVC
jgi:2-polyprenyl-3-methyl-5-hydroxy-6-metoxy-1,4-benzoquinol methylase